LSTYLKFTYLANYLEQQTPFTDGLTPLHHFIASRLFRRKTKHTEQVTKLPFNAGTDASDKDLIKQAAFHKQSENETTPIELLIAHGPDPKYVDKFGHA
jgi:hypothetical protein